MITHFIVLVKLGGGAEVVFFRRLAEWHKLTHCATRAILPPWLELKTRTQGVRR